MSQVSIESDRPGLLRYILYFCGVYIICVIIMVVVSMLLQFDLPSSTGIIALIAALSAPVSSFVNNNQRVMTKRERARFSLGVGLASLVISFGFIALQKALIRGSNELDQLTTEAAGDGLSPAIIYAGIAGIAFILTWVVTYFFAGFHANQTLKRLNKAK
jgi:uncharacterized membrane protein (DUF485 family)